LPGVGLSSPIGLSALAVAGLLAQSPAELEERGFAALRQPSYPEALEAFESLIAREPLRPTAHYGKGLALSGLLDYGGAVESFEKAVALDPSYAAAFRQLAIHYAQLGLRERARAAYQKAKALGPAPDPVRLALARALRKAGWLEEARQILDAVSLSSEEHLELALLAQEENPKEAAAHFAAATRDPVTSAAEAEYEYGRTLEELGRPVAAAEHYRRALEKKPGLHAARFRLGNVLMRSGKKEEGRALLGGYEDFRFWDRKVQLLLAMVSSGTLSESDRKQKTLELIDLLLQGGSLDEAVPLIQAGLARHPEELRFRLEFAKLLHLRKQFDEAREALRPLLALVSPPAGALRLSGQLHLEQGQLTGAREAYMRALQLSPNPSAQLLKEMGTVHALGGEVELAEAFFRKAIEKDPSLAVVRADLGMLLESVGRKQEAETLYRHALEVEPMLVSAQQGLASLHLERGETEKALTLFRESVRLRPKDPVLRLNLALALEKLGMKGEAQSERDLAREIEARARPRDE